MSAFNSPKFLRNVLSVDAAAGAANSLLHLLAAGLLAQLLGLPQELVVISGVALLLYAALPAYLAACNPIPRRPVLVQIAANWAWTVGCAAVFVIYAPALTTLGQAYLVLQAVAVAVLAELEWFALRAAPRAGWA